MSQDEQINADVSSASETEEIFERRGGGPKRPSLYDHDFLLDYFVYMMEQGVMSFDITLLIDGQYVSGRPITRREFLEGLGATFRDALPQDAKTGERFHHLFSAIAESLEPLASPLPTTPGEGYTAGVAIHLKNVNIKVGDNVTTIPFWRGKTIAVSAWFPGRMDSPSA